MVSSGIEITIGIRAFVYNSITHFKPYKGFMTFFPQYGCIVNPVRGHEFRLHANDFKALSKCNNTSSTIAAKGCRTAIRIVEDHLKVVLSMVPEQNDPISANPEMPVTKLFDNLATFREKPGTIINENEVIARTMIFYKRNLDRRYAGSY